MILVFILFMLQIPIGVTNHKLYRRFIPTRPKLHNSLRSSGYGDFYLLGGAVASLINILSISAIWGWFPSLCLSILANFLGWNLSTVGLTGGIGSGKSKASQYIRSELNIQVVDADVIAREIVRRGSSGYRAVVERFGSGVVDARSGELDRLALGRLIFSDSSQRRHLERITHPRILLEMLRQLVWARLRGFAVVLDVPLLFESRSPPLLYLFCNECLCLDLNAENQKKRLKARNPDLLDSEIEQRIKSQIPRDQRIAIADYVVNNDGKPEELFEQLRKYFRND